jgi:hypothetical protein
MSCREPVSAVGEAFQVVVRSRVVVRCVGAHPADDMSPYGRLGVHASSSTQIVDHILRLKRTVHTPRDDGGKRSKDLISRRHASMMMGKERKRVRSNFRIYGAPCSWRRVVAVTGRATGAA